MPDSVLEAIKRGIWDFEPEAEGQVDYEPTAALPGSNEKLSVLTERVQRGLPLWHPHDRLTYEDPEAEALRPPAIKAIAPVAAAAKAIEAERTE